MQMLLSRKSEEVLTGGLIKPGQCQFRWNSLVSEHCRPTPPKLKGSDLSLLGRCPFSRTFLLKATHVNFMELNRQARETCLEDRAV